MTAASIVDTAKASTYFVNKHPNTTMHLFPDNDVGKGPRQSAATIDDD